jgi:amidohydrolase
MVHDFKQHIISEIDKRADNLWEISSAIYDDPEIAFKEFNACKLITESLKSVGYFIEIGIGGLETAFRATIGNDTGPSVAILAEYDALVGLGHACGHNLIAAAAVGSGMALSPIIPKLQGQIQIIGTPAEEGGGGKILLAEAGFFNSVDAAMMFHPADKNMVLRQSLASSKLKIEFFGKASHAAAAPEEGINALDAMILTFNNINALRPTFTSKDRVAGIILEGGKAANIIPAYTSADFSIRSSTTKRRDVLIDKVIACAQSSAQAIGCKFQYNISPGYKNIIPNKVLAALFTSNLESLGRSIADIEPNERMGSTDMGDISHLVPSIHPYLAIAPEKTAGHTLKFKEYSHSETGKTAMLDAAKALAMTAFDLLANPVFLTKARAELISEQNAN